MPSISLDFDKINDPRMLRAVRYLFDKYEHRVMMRKSSSGRGWHIRVFPLVMANAGRIEPYDYDEHCPEIELEIRKMLGDCIGRCIADEARVKTGLKSSRLFFVKSGKQVGKWIPASQWLSEHR